MNDNPYQSPEEPNEQPKESPPSDEWGWPSIAAMVLFVVVVSIVLLAILLPAVNSVR